MNEKTILKRTVKDSVFTDLFGQPKYLMQLYEALHPEDTDVTIDDIADVTLRNILSPERVRLWIYIRTCSTKE